MLIMAYKEKRVTLDFVQRVPIMENEYLDWMKPNPYPYLVSCNAKLQKLDPSFFKKPHILFWILFKDQCSSIYIIRMN